MSNIIGANTPDIAPQEPECVRFAEGWDDLLATVMNDDFEVAIWNRDISSVSHSVSHIPASDFDIISGDRDHIFSEFGGTYVTSDWPEYLETTVKGDVFAFIEAAETQTPKAMYRVRLQAVSDDACRKFHQDRTFQRLIITYRGDGTVWQHIGDPVEYRAKERDCVLLRGKRIGQDPLILHRSPRFVTGRPPRLILVIDVIPKFET